MARKRNYINNKDFANTLHAWVLLCRIAKEAEEPRPLIPLYVAECFLKIVTKYGSKRNFSGYTYIEDMKSEALEHCIKYADRFKMEKSENAFSYFTQITHNAFIQFINKEKKFAKFKFDINSDTIENAHKFNYNGIADQREHELEKFLKEIEDNK